MKTPEERASDFAKKKQAAYMKEYREKNRERILQKQKEYDRARKVRKGEDSRDGER